MIKNGKYLHKSNNTQRSLLLVQNYPREKNLMVIPDNQEQALKPV